MPRSPSNVTIRIPRLYFESGEDLLEGGAKAGQAAVEDYIVNRYHSPKDEYDDDWDWRGTMADLKLYYSLGRELANTEAWPNWVAGDEFRAIRDQSRESVPGGK